MTYRVEVLEQLSCGGLEDALHHIAHQVLQSVQEVVKGDEGTLRFDVSVPEAQEIVSAPEADHFVLLVFLMI